MQRAYNYERKPHYDHHTLKQLYRLKIATMLAVGFGIIALFVYLALTK